MSQVSKCPKCESQEVVSEEKTLFYVNSGDCYCHSVKAHDSNARAVCLSCRWEGQRQDLVVSSEGKRK